METMKYFHKLLYDEDVAGCQVVEDYDCSSTIIKKLFLSQQMKGDSFREVKLFINASKEPTDYLRNPLSWPIFSERMALLLFKKSRNDIQIFDAPLYDSRKETPIPGYKILNIVKCLPCLNLEKSTVSYSDIGKKKVRGVSDFIFDNNRIPNNICVFRPAEWRYSIFFSDSLAKSLIGKDLAGIAFLRCRAM